MAWIEVHQALLTHRKTLRLARLLKMDKFAVVGRLVALWLWSLDNAPSGNLFNDDIDLLADVMGWESDISTLVDALISSGFIDIDEDGQFSIHDWQDYAGRLIDKREQNAEKQRRWRETHKTNTLPANNSTQNDTHLPYNSDVTVTLPSCDGATVPNRTVPNPTIDPSSEPSELGEAIGANAPPVDASATHDVGEKLKVFGEDTQEYQLASHLRSKILERNPTARVPGLSPCSLAPWAKHIDRMIRIDHRGGEDIRRVIDFCQSDTFWQDNVLSTQKLREKYDTLAGKMRTIHESSKQKPQVKPEIGAYDKTATDAALARYRRY
jgi:hypothetical protein